MKVHFPVLSILLLWGLSSIVQGYSDSSFYAESFSQLNRDHFQLLGARLNPLAYSVLLTSSDETYSASALWYKQPVFLRGFRSNFTFSLDKAGKEDSAHGLVFLIQNDLEGSLALGGVAAGLGYASATPEEFKGIENSVAIELDCIGNPEMNDPTEMHLSVHTRGTNTNSANEHHASVYVFKQMADFCSGTPGAVNILYEPGRLVMTVTPIVSPVVDFAIKIEEILTLQGNGKGYIGFTSSTGAHGANQEVLTWGYSFIGKGNATNSQATGLGLTAAVAGDAASFVIVAYDQYNNPYPFGGNQIVVTLSGPGTTTPSITDFGNGTYQVDYTLTLAGPYAMQVLFDGTPLGNAPRYDVVVTHSTPAGSTTSPLDPVPSSPKASATETFRVQLRDRFGNAVTSGGAEVVASLSPIDSRDSTSVIDNQDGTYSISLTTFKAQAYSLTVTLNGAGISGSPFRMNTQPGDIDPGKSIIPNLPQELEAGKTSQFTLVTMDSYENQLRTGGAVVGVVPTPQDETFDLYVEDRADGTYAISVYFEKAAEYQLAVTVNGILVTAGIHPLDVIAAEVSIKDCEASGEDFTLGLSGVSSNFLILSKDRFSNLYGKPISFKYSVLIIGTTANISASAVNNDDGTTSVSYTPIVSGKYTTHITAEGTPIKNSPGSTSISPTSPSAKHTSVLDVHYHFVDPHVLKTTWLQVQIRDQNLNDLAVGGHKVAATVEPTSNKRKAIQPMVLDNKNGTYTVSFTPTESQDGEYILTITLDKENINGSPFTLNIIPTDQTNVIALAVGIPVVVICIVALGGLIWYRKWKKPATSGYSLLPQSAS